MNLIKKHYPTLIDNLSTTVSPMCAVSRMLKAKDPETVTVFIGPCMAKKAEAADKSVEGNADFVLTFGEAIELMRAKDVELEPEEYKDQEASVFGKRFGNGGGDYQCGDPVLKGAGREHRYQGSKMQRPGRCEEGSSPYEGGKAPRGLY